MRRSVWMLCAVPLLFLGCSPERTSYKVQDGVLDMRSAQVDSSFILNLDGAWEFYWKRLLTPGDFQ